MKALFLTSSVGLGHVARDYQVYLRLVDAEPGVSVDWCATNPPTVFLRHKGLRVLGACEEMESFSRPIEELYRFGYRTFRLGLLRSYLDILRRNYEVLLEGVDVEGYDLLFLDEFWEGLVGGIERVHSNVVFMTDFIYKPYGWSPAGNMLSLILNTYYRRRLPQLGETLFPGVEEDLPDSRWYPLFGERVREWARRHMRIVGRIPSFDPEALPPREAARDRLGYTEKTAIITIGGTATGHGVVEKICRVFPKDYRLVVVMGPRAPPPRCDAEIHGYVDDLYLHIYAADLVVSRAGFTTVVDISYLGTPSILVPIKGHFEQEEIARRFSKTPFIEMLGEDEIHMLPRVVRRLEGSGGRLGDLNKYLGASVAAKYLAGRLGQRY